MECYDLQFSGVIDNVCAQLSKATPWWACCTDIPVDCHSCPTSHQRHPVCR